MPAARPNLIAIPLRAHAPAQPKPSDRAKVAVYRPFFAAGMVSVLTAGCLLGAIALLGIALQGSYTASAWTPYVLAHANSQLYGWVGFFVMGFALQQHAPPVAKLASFIRLAWASLVLMAAGIALRFVAEPMVVVDRERWLAVGVASGVLQFVAVALFCINSGANRHRTGEGLPWQALFIFGSLGWWLIVAALEPVAFAASHGPDRMQSIMAVAEWFHPLREAQFLGFVAMMVFGVALSKFHTCFGLPEPRRAWGVAAFAFWSGGLVLRIMGWLVHFRAGMTLESAAMLRFGGLAMALGAVMVVVALGVFERLQDRYPSQKFIRAGFAWLLVAGLMTVLEPIHLAWIGAPFSHAYTGAIRHAVTVGFISQMILGVSLHVVSRMSGRADTHMPRLWPTFALLNLGNALRVGLEVATDTTPSAFGPMGATGFVELVALGLWAAAIAGMMFGRLRGPRFAESGTARPIRT